MTFEALQVDCKRAIAQIRGLNNDELDQILQDNDKMSALLSTLDQHYLKDIASEKESLLEYNKSMAERNLAKEPQLVENRELVMKLWTEGEELSSRVKEKYDKIREHSGDMSLETVLALLQTAASEVEEESEKTAKKFLSNELEVDDFIEEFLEKRKIVHLRLVKAEKMTKLISRDPMLNSNYMNTPPMGLNANYFPGYPPNPSPASVPYPVGEFHMPMPRIPYYQNNY